MTHITKLLFGATCLACVSCSETAPDDALIGYVEADWSYVAAPSAGWITARPVEEGSRVTSGDLLFTLDSVAEQAAVAQATARIEQLGADVTNLSTGARQAEIRALEARLAEAEARLNHAANERNRILPLVEQGVEQSARGDQVQADYRIAVAAVKAAEEDIAVAKLSARPAQRDAAGAAVRMAEADRETALYRLDQRAVSARFSGDVTEVFYAPGEYVMPGAPVLALLPDDGLTVRFFVPQADLPELKIGKEIDILADGAEGPIIGLVRHIASDAEFTPPVIYTRGSREKLVFMIEANVPVSSGLKAGLPVEVSW